MNYPYIAIEGNIGAGKTTLAKQLAHDFNALLVLEQFEENPFLPDFYANKKSSALPLELFFMAERYQQLQELTQKDLFTTNIISDYIFGKSKLFSENTLSKHEFQLYLRLFSIIYQQLPLPDLIVYLHTNVTQLQKNIRKRGRDFERNISNDYLTSIEHAYFNHFKQIKSKTRILILQGENLDFVNNKSDYEYIKKLLVKEYTKGMHIL